MYSPNAEESASAAGLSKEEDLFMQEFKYFKNSKQLRDEAGLLAFSESKIIHLQGLDQSSALEEHKLKVFSSFLEVFAFVY